MVPTKLYLKKVSPEPWKNIPIPSYDTGWLKANYVLLVIMGYNLLQ